VKVKSGEYLFVPGLKELEASSSNVCPKFQTCCWTELRLAVLVFFHQQDALTVRILLSTFGQMVVRNSFALHEWPENAALSCGGVLERPML